jgi:hypothetical protein
VPAGGVSALGWRQGDRVDAGDMDRDRVCQGVDGRRLRRDASREHLDDLHGDLPTDGGGVVCPCREPKRREVGASSCLRMDALDPSVVSE